MPSKKLLRSLEFCVYPLTRGPKQDHMKHFVGSSRHLHARRSYRHTCDSQSDGRRSFGQKTPNCRSWHVALDDVSLDLGRMAGAEGRRNRKLRLKRRKVTNFVYTRRETGCLHMLYPTGTTAAAGVFVEDHRRRCCI